MALNMCLKRCVLSMLLAPLDSILVVQGKLGLRMSIFGSNGKEYTVFGRVPTGIR